MVNGVCFGAAAGAAARKGEGRVFRVLHFRPVRLWPVPFLAAALLLAPRLAAAAGGTAACLTAETGQPASRVIYLTFDDGPSAGTEQLLRVLDRHGVKATFFVTGQYEGDKAALLRRIDAGGHTIGLHTYEHRYDRIYAGKAAFFADLEKTDRMVYQAVGRHSRFYRFPGGSANTHCPGWLRTQLKQELARRGIVYFDWNVVSGDQGKKVYAAGELFDHVVRGAGQVRGGPLMILFHDTGHCTTTPAAVDLVISYFEKRGWTFLPVTAQTAPIRFKTS